MCRRVFRYEKLSIGVRSDEDADLEWLEEFLAPQFGREEKTDTDWELTLAHDGGVRERLAALGPADEDVVCFALDTRDIHLPRWNSSAHVDLVFDEKFDTLYRVNARDRLVTLVAGGDRGGGRIALMRVVRELAMNRVQSDGGVIVHGAAFAIGGRGVIVAGPKGAGKTTLLMYVLQSTEAAYVSNDRLLLSLDPPTWRIRGIPTIVTVRRPTLDFFPPIQERMRDRGFALRLTLREARQRRVPLPGTQLKVPSIGPGQLCALLEAKSTAGAPATAVLFPRLSDRTGPLRLTEISRKRAAERLFDSLFGVRKLRSTSPVFSDAPDQPTFDRVRLEAACATLASVLPCYECELGPEAYADPRSAPVLLDHLAEPA